MSQSLKRYAKEAGKTTDFSMHSCRSGGAVSIALEGEPLSAASRKSPKTAWKYMRLMEVVFPGAKGGSMMEGVEAQYWKIHEFRLSEQSRSSEINQ